MAKIYTTEKNHRDEMALATRIAEAWGCEMRFNGKLAPIDFQMWRDKKMFAWVEIKGDRTTYASTDESVKDGAWLKPNKAHELWTQWVRNHIPGLYFVRWSDKVVFMNIKDYPPPWETKRRGRFDRPNDPTSIEELIIVPHEIFKTFKE